MHEHQRERPLRTGSELFHKGEKALFMSDVLFKIPYTTITLSKTIICLDIGEHHKEHDLPSLGEEEIGGFHFFCGSRFQQTI